MKKRLAFDIKKNTWHVESNYVLQPPGYLIIIVNRFRYTNNNATKDMGSIPMDITIVLGLHRFSLQATIDYHGPSIYYGHYTTSVNCCEKHYIATTEKLQSLKWLLPKSPLPYIWQCIYWLRNAIWNRTGGWEFDYSHGTGTSAPFH